MTDLYKTPKELNLVFLDAEKAYNQLNEHEKDYAYALYEAVWEGAPIVARQCSAESENLLNLIVSMFSNLSKTELFEFTDYAESFGLDKTDAQDFVNYFALVCANLGNYRSFGDRKIVPRLSEDKMDKIVVTLFPEHINKYNELKGKIYSLNDNEKMLGYPPNNTTMYLSSNLTKIEVDIVDEFLVESKLEGWNTRLVKLDSDNPLYIVYIASAYVPEEKHVTNVRTYKGLSIVVSYGDHSTELKYMVEKLTHVEKVALNDTEKNMIQSYIKHFTYGDLNDHKESQKHWIKDKGPVVETNMGFIENYRDPAGKRSEFEGFVSVVDKEKSKKLQVLVDNAPKFLATLPWPNEFEKDVFHPPDFTALDVITFCNSGIPAGINIPNYDEIRMHNGFKNVSLDNVIRSAYGSGSDEPVDYLTSEDSVIFKKYVLKSFTVDVAGHELLGHGSGKLFRKSEDGTFNFDKNTINPITNKPVETWYEPGETWSSKFGRMGSSYEECRAECVGLYLACNRDMHRVFGNNDEEWKDIMYTSWMWMIKGGIESMVAFNVDKNNWSQAHCQARYVIYKVLTEAGNDFVKVELTENGTNFLVKVDKDKIESVGLPALKNFLMKLNVYKSIADYKNGSELYSKYSTVDGLELQLRDIHLKKRKPRREYIQPTLKNKQYISYPVTATGMIKSVIDKYPVH
jgi:dipeptidyl-peptidase III